MELYFDAGLRFIFQSGSAFDVLLDMGCGMALARRRVSGGGAFACVVGCCEGGMLSMHRSLEIAYAFGMGVGHGCG